MKRKQAKLEITKPTAKPEVADMSTVGLSLEDVYRIVVALEYAGKDLIKSQFGCIQQKGYRYMALAGKIDTVHRDLQYSSTDSFRVKFFGEPKGESK